MNPNSLERLKGLVNGDREPENGMERHFLKVIKGDGLACTPELKEWYQCWTSLKDSTHSQSQLLASKSVVILANSTKIDPGRCIAGIEYLEAGNWIRPISNEHIGQLYPDQTILDDGLQPFLLDIVEIPLLKKVDSPMQPENWHIDSTRTWKRHPDKKCSQEYLLTMIEEPDNLWLQSEIEADRVSSEYLQENLPSQSLYLIKINDVALIKYKNCSQKDKVRANFSYHGINYSLNVTDPNVHNILKDSTVVKINKAVACISLAHKYFNSYAKEFQHFKLVASIILID